METLLLSLGFNQDKFENNLFYRDAENGNCDVIKYLPCDGLYNAYLSIGSLEFINEKELAKIINK